LLESHIAPDNWRVNFTIAKVYDDLTADK